MMGAGVQDATHGRAPGSALLQLVAFADRPALIQLRNATDLHRGDALLRVVLDGDRFELAWGDLSMSGSLFQWDWCQASEHDAYYSEARWGDPMEAGNVNRTRRKAACVWTCPAREAAHLRRGIA